MVDGGGSKGVSRPMFGVVAIRASVMKLAKQNGKDGSLIEGQATNEGTFNDKKFLTLRRFRGLCFLIIVFLFCFFSFPK